MAVMYIEKIPKIGKLVEVEVIQLGLFERVNLVEFGSSGFCVETRSILIVYLTK